MSRCYSMFACFVLVSCTLFALAQCEVCVLHADSSAAGQVVTKQPLGGPITSATFDDNNVLLNDINGVVAFWGFYVSKPAGFTFTLSCEDDCAVDKEIILDDGSGPVTKILDSETAMKIYLVKQQFS